MPNYVAVLRGSVDPMACVCFGTDRCMEANHDRCELIRQRVSSIEWYDACREVMSFLFDLADEFTLGTRSVAMWSGDEDKQADRTVSDDESDNENSQSNPCE